MDNTPGHAQRGLARGFAPGRAALIAYVMAGYPDRETSLESLRAVARAGADVIELGVPYGDPLADGPVIAEAAKAAMAAAGGRFGLLETIGLAAAFVREGGASGDPVPPVALMTYLNPMLRANFAIVAERADLAHISGFIVPDMPPDSPFAKQWLALAEPLGMDTAFLVAPTSTAERIAIAAAASRGFVYCVSSIGVTGERADLASGLADLVARVREAAGATPVAVGFGVSTPEQAAEVGRIADGVVVGSAIVRRQNDPVALEAFVVELRAALDGAA